MAYEKWSSIEKVKRYHEKRYKSIDQKIVDRLEKRVVKNIFDKFSINYSILDIPCGYGRFHPLLSQYGGIHAADNDKLIAKYQKKEIGISKSTTICGADSMPYEDNSFNVVFCFRLIQHIHNSSERIAIYKEFKRVSKEWVIISLYEKTTLHSAIKRISRKNAKITFLERAQVHKEFTEANLTPVYKRSIMPGIHAHKVYLAKKSI